MTDLDLDGRRSTCPSSRGRDRLAGVELGAGRVENGLGGVPAALDLGAQAVPNPFSVSAAVLAASRAYGSDGCIGVCGLGSLSPSRYSVARVNGGSAAAPKTSEAARLDSGPTGPPLGRPPIATCRARRLGLSAATRATARAPPRRRSCRPRPGRGGRRDRSPSGARHLRLVGVGLGAGAERRVVDDAPTPSRRSGRRRPGGIPPGRPA